MMRVVSESEPDDIADLLDFVHELGATDADIEAAAPVAGLGPLALDYSIRPTGEAVSLDEYAGRHPEREAFVRELWRALGFPDSAPFPFPVTPDMAEALDALLLLSGTLGESAVLGFARVIGAATDQLSDALTSTTRLGVEVPQRDTGVPYAAIAREYSHLARELLPVLWDAVGAVFRRHLVLGSYQSWSVDADRLAVTAERAVGFVDLVGSTDVLRTVSVGELAALVDRFERYVGDLVIAHGGRVVKLIGDEALFTFSDAATAGRVAAALVDSAPSPVRVGLDVGPVVALHGDVYGPTVNLAARLVAIAEPGTVVVSAAMRDTAGDALAAAVRRPVADLRGFPDVTEVYVLG